MLQYNYSGYDQKRKKIKGKVEARDKQEAFQLLKRQGLLVTELTELKPSLWTKEIEFLTAGVKQRDFVIFCRQFSTLLRASVGIADALQILVEQTESKALQKALIQALEDVRSGLSLSAACQAQPKVFPTIFVSMISAGETSGNLDDMLEKLAGYFEKENSVREKIKSALVYPITVGALSIVVTFFLMWKTIPQFVSVFQNMGLELPWLTQVVMNASERLSKTGVWFAVLPFVGWGILSLIRKNERGRYQLDWLKLKMPIFGSLFLKSSLARFSRTFATLYEAAVPVIPALAILTDVVGNEVMSKSLFKARESLRTGQSLAQPFRDNPMFPPMVVQMLAIGERTGNLDDVMGKVADYYEDEVNQMAERLRSMIEPVMLVVVSIIVGFIVLAVLLPTFSLYEGIR